MRHIKSLLLLSIFDQTGIQKIEAGWDERVSGDKRETSPDPGKAFPNRHGALNVNPFMAKKTNPH